MSFEVKQQEDSLPGRIIMAIALVAVVIILVSIWTAARLLGAEGARVHGARVSDVPREEVGVVEQSLIDRSDRAIRMRRRGAQQLSSYGWVDRNGGVTHVPIERAIDLYVETERATR